MPWRYLCEECGQELNPEKKFKEDKCRTCGKPVEPKYICPNCGHLWCPKGRSLRGRCPNCGSQISDEEVESKSYEKVTMKDGEMTLNVKGGGKTQLEAVEKISLNIWGEKIARIENPDYAEFSIIEDFEETEDGVDLHFQPQEMDKLLEKIKQLKELKSSSDN